MGGIEPPITYNPYMTLLPRQLKIYDGSAPIPPIVASDAFPPSDF